MNGQRFHQQKRIEMKTEQCERSLRIEYEHAVVLVHSCVHDRLRPREMIGFTDNSRFLSRIQIQGYG